jgi:hypothetical protein
MDSRSGPAAAFHVVGVHGPAADGGEGVGEVTRLVEGVGVQRHRQVGDLGHGEARVDHRRSRAPVLVHLEAAAARQHRLLQQVGRRRRAAGQERGIDRDARPAVDERVQVGARVGPDVPDPADAHPDDRGDARRERRRYQVGVGQVDVRVDDPGRREHALTGDHGGVGVDLQLDAVLHVGVPGAADAHHAPVLDPDVGLADTEHGVEHHDAEHDHVQRRGAAGGAAHEGAVPGGLAAAADQLLPGLRVVGVDLDPQVGVGEPDPVAGGGAVEPRVPGVIEGAHEPPLSRTTATSRSAPASTRSAVPAGTSRR